MNAGKVYEQFLQPLRVKPTDIKGRSPSEESESDRARLIFSSPFRRLQQKAQVFSLEENAAVRSRLTHSFEVSQIGRYLALEAVKGLKSKYGADALGLDDERTLSFINTVETACLMHDLGNPPFGHFGEAAISGWFDENKKEIVESLGAKVSGPCPFSDFSNFDGNCQGLRIVTKLQWNRDEFGLNLSYPQLAAYLKYVCAPREIESSNPIKKKAGYFETESDVVAKIWDAMGLERGARFPLVYLMEAADDIAYCVSDIEDAIEKEIVTEAEFFKFLSKPEHQEGVPSDHWFPRIIANCINDMETVDLPMRAFMSFRTEITRQLTRVAANTFVTDHDLYLQGRQHALLEAGLPSKVLDVLKSFAISKIYRHPSVTSPELAGDACVRGILDHFKPLLTCSHERFSAILDFKKKDSNGGPIVKEARLASYLPRKHVRAYRHSVSDLDMGRTDALVRERVLRAHLVTDFVSGMTDDFALSFYQLLHGICIANER